MTATLVLLRHGESEWNAKNLFTGWVDVDLTERARTEAVRGGELLGEAGLLPDVVHTSLLRRAIRTAELALDAGDRQWIPVRRSWRLNERHYGALQGKDKAATRGGVRRRAVHALAPVLRRAAAAARRRRRVSPGRRPALRRPARDCGRAPSAWRTSCDRMLPYWYDAIVPDLRAGRRCLVAAHGNSLRALVKHLDGLSDEEVVGLNIPTGIPLRYDLDDDLQPVTAGGDYLDPEAAAAPSRRSRTRAARPVTVANYGDWQFATYLGGLQGVRPELPMSWADLERRAEQTLSPELWSYVAGGAGDERTQRANVEAFDAGGSCRGCWSGRPSGTCRCSCSAAGCRRRC